MFGPARPPSREVLQTCASWRGPCDQYRFSFLQRAARMAAAAWDLDGSLRILAALAAVFLVVRHLARACRVGAFLFFCVSHGEFPFLSECM